MRVHLRQALAFNAEQFRESRDLGHAPFRKKNLGLISGVSLGTRVSNFKSVA